MPNAAPDSPTAAPPSESPGLEDTPETAPRGDSPPGTSHELPYREELRRKALHLMALALPLAASQLGRPLSLMLLAPAAVLALTCDVLRSYSPRFARIIQRVFGRMMRADEWDTDQNASGGTHGGLRSIRVNGATWTLVTMTLLTVLFPLPVAVASFALFMIGDAAAALVGRRYGRTHWGDGPRTVEGTAAFVVAAGLALAPLMAGGYLAVPGWVAALAVAVGAGAEALPRPLNDNLRVPLLAALVLHVLS